MLSTKHLYTWCLYLCVHVGIAQNFSQSNLDFNGFPTVNNATSLAFGPDGRLYVLDLDGQINVYGTVRIGQDQYRVTSAETINEVRNIPNHNDDGIANNAVTIREATGLTVSGTANQPIIYVTSSDSRIGGPSGDQNLDTNSGVITRLAWNGNTWDVVDIVRGLPRSEENHATNGLEFVSLNGTDYLIVCSGGHTNAGSPSDNFAWTTEYALSAAVLSINLTTIEGMPILIHNGRKYVYDIPTLDDPTRNNVFSDGSPASEDPNDSNYSPIDERDPWGGNDGLNQAMIVPGGPVQIFSPGFRNTYDLVLTESGAVYVTDNGPNGGWGGLPENEGGGSVTNRYLIGEPGSSTAIDGEQVTNRDHLHKVTNDISTYSFGSFYGGHPNPVRANPNGAGLYTNPGVNSISSQAFFRTQKYDPNASSSGSTSDPNRGLPANWPPVPNADHRQGDFRSAGDVNPDGINDDLVTTWSNNTNGIDEYTASNFGGAMQGNLIAGKSGGKLFRIVLNNNGSLNSLDENFQTNLGGNPLGITCNGDNDPHPGTIWVATFNSNIKIMEPADAVECFLPGHPSYLASGDNDADGYTNQDEIDNRNQQSIESVICNPGNQPEDFDKDAGGMLVSNLNDTDDDNDGIPDSEDVMQLGDFLNGGEDAFNLPVLNDLYSDNNILKGYLGLGFTGLMNNGENVGNWINWIDMPGDGPNPNDLLGGAVGAMTMQMGHGTALGNENSQRKGFQYGVQVDQSTGGFTVQSRLFNFYAPLQLYGNQAPANGELGIFIGDGTQSNYIKLVISQQGLRVQQEINDVPQSPIDLIIPSAQRPQDPNDNVLLTFAINPSNGEVTGQFSFDQGQTFNNVGSLIAQGNILQAIQSASRPLIVGLIGTSNQAGIELEGSWDYLYVQGSQPTIQQNIPDFNRPLSAASDQINLDLYFDDDGGDNNLTYSVQGNSNPAIDVNINESTLSITYSSEPATSSIIVRATDINGLYVQQAFTVTVSATAEPTPIFRIRTAGPDVAATDAPFPDWQGTPAGAYSGNGFSVNTGNNSTHDLQNIDISVPGYVPTEISLNNRWDGPELPQMEFEIPLINSDYIIRLYMGNGWIGANQPGERVFDIIMEENVVHKNFDPVARFGHRTLGMIENEITVVDGRLNISFEHNIQNPNIFGIEILGYPISIDEMAHQNNVSGDLINLIVSAQGGTNAPFQFTASGLPPGLQIEPTTGLIFGEIAADAPNYSPYTTTISASKPGSIPAEMTFNWTITGPQWNDQTDDENYTARHECSFVQAGDKFYLFGGRENSTTLDVYDYTSKTWSPIPNSAPKEFNHFQAVEFEGLIWVIAAFKSNSFPDEVPEERIWMYNPALNEWIQGPLIPSGRRRGSAGVGMYEGKFYIVGGNTQGHNGGYVDWFDEFDPATGQWTSLPSAPRTRDHFHAQVIGSKLYVAGGRRTGSTGGTFEPLVKEVDVYDFITGQWTTVSDIPTPRAAAAVAEYEGRLFVMGGEIRNDLNGNAVFDAVRTTESFDPVSGQWSSEPNLITERHGTQAIVSGDGIHIASGSDKLGGGRIKQMEYFGQDNPTGIPSVSSTLEVVNFVEVPVGGQANIDLTAVNGNVALILQETQITGTHASSFNVSSGFSLIKAGQTKTLSISHTGSVSGETAILTIHYDNGSTKLVTLQSVSDVSSLDLTVQLQGRSDYSGSIQVYFCDPANNQQVYGGNYTANTAGQFTINDIDPGIYNVYVRKARYLRRAVMDVHISPGSNNLLFLESEGMELRSGDANNSNAVNANDLNILQDAYFTFSGNTGFNSNADFNGSGGITIIDFSILASNFGDAGGPICSSSTSGTHNNAVAPVHLKTEPAFLRLAENEESSFFVVCENPDRIPINGVDFRMVFDPDKIEILNIEDVYGWPIQLLNRVELSSRRIMYSAGTTGFGLAGNSRLLKVKIRAKAAIGNSTFYFDRSEPMLTEMAAKGYSVTGNHTPLSIENLGPCPEVRTLDHSPIVDGSFLAGQKIEVMGNPEVINSLLLNAPRVEIPSSLQLESSTIMTIRKDGCQ